MASSAPKASPRDYCSSVTQQQPEGSQGVFSSTSEQVALLRQLDVGQEDLFENPSNCDERQRQTCKL